MKSNHLALQSCVALAMVVSTVVVFFASSVRAAGELKLDENSIYDLPEAVAIQGRKYLMDQSLHLGAGYLPTDSFNKGWTLSLGYRFSLTDYFSWEVIEYTHNFNGETQLKGDLRSLNVTVKNVGFGGVLDYPRQIFMTALYYSPLYSKSLLFNSRLIYSETSLYLGVGTLNFDKTGVKPTIAPGFNTRFYVGEKSAVTVWFRDYVFRDENIGVSTILSFGLGFEYRFHLFSSGGDKVAKNGARHESSL